MGFITDSNDGAMNKQRPKMHFAVIGGSLGGLATGIALKTHGHDVTILERNPEPLLHNQGAGIVAGGDTLDFFKQYDRCNRPIAVSSQRRHYLNRKGEVVHHEDMVQNMTSWDLAYHIMRANFDGTPSSYCTVPPPDPSHGKAIHLHGHTFTDVETEGTQLRIHFHRDNDSTNSSLLADRLIGADGPNSHVRRKFLPNITRQYAGYCALRGTVPELSASPSARAAFSEKFAFFHGPGVQILAYLIPGKNGSIEPGERLINFVYYTNFAPGSAALETIMTDQNGERHRITMPPGKMDMKVAWEEQRRIASEVLPPQFAEIVRATENPFVQAITDVICPEHEFMDGKVVLVGDALAGFRPHTVASTSQAAYDAMVLAEYVEGVIDRDEWKKKTLGYARYVQKMGVDMGTRSQFEDLTLDEYVQDRNVASVPRKDVVYPDWATAY